MSNQIQDLYIVGIGASAGGLQALEVLFDHMPSSSGMAFVIVQHLSPKYKSLMDNLLAKHTAMPVKVVEGGDTVTANTVYLIPPNTQMTIHNGVLNLTERAEGPTVELPIDVFFASLADDARNRAIGIVLSGTGSDGAQGIRRIHANGGLVIAQEPASAQFDGMPASAVKTQVADYILPPEQIPNYLLEYVGLAPKDKQDGSGLRPKTNQPRDRIAQLLRKKFFLDVSQYKEHTFERRLQRRMALKKLADLADYAEVLESDPDEIDALYKDLLIGVTGFFRDREYWLRLRKYLAEEFSLPTPGGQGIRMWSAGCATGEEAYSLAIVCQELAEEHEGWADFTVFATDVHAGSLELASAGLFAEDRLENVSAERLERFFQRESSDTYRVDPQLRKRVIFAPHNLINDPPFTRLSLIACRNVLIYIKPEAQERIISLFHYALNPGGLLFLGSSEGLGQAAEGFSTINQQAKLFMRSGDHQPRMHLPAMLKNQGAAPPISTQPVSNRGRITIERDLLEDYDMILDRFIPASLLLDRDYKVLHYFGDVSDFLKPLAGRAEFTAPNLIRDDHLHAAVTVGLQKALENRSQHITRNVRTHKGGRSVYVDVAVQYLPHSQEQGHYLVSFRNEVETQISARGDADGTEFAVEGGMRQRVQDLETELEQTKANLQATVEELQTSNEELQAANEELLASNEELQSTNEELHSLNEELYTVNSEFERKNEELNRLIEDHDNLLTSTQVGTIFLDDKLRIRKFNPAITQFFKLLPQDIGRPIDHIAYHLGSQHTLLTDLRTVLETSEAIERELEPEDDYSLLVRILPFMTNTGQTAGVVLTFTDISKVKTAQRELEQRQGFHRAVLDALSAEIAVLDHDGVIVDVNQPWRRFAAENGAAGKDFIGCNYIELCERARGRDAEEAVLVADRLRQILAGDITSFETVYPCHAPHGEQRWFFLKAFSIDSDLGSLVLSHENITALKQAERSLEKLNDELEHKVMQRTTELQQEANQRKRVAQDLQERLELESVVNGISSQFIHVSVTDLDRQILTALPKLARPAAMDRAYLCLRQSDSEDLTLAYRWPESDQHDCCPIGPEATPFWWSQLSGFSPVLVSDPAQLPSQAQKEKLWLEEQGAASIVLIPLVYSGILYGCLGLEADQAHSLRLLRHTALLHIVGEVFVNALKRKESEETLKQYHQEIQTTSRELAEANRQIEVEIEKARQLHTNLLPKIMPSLSGYKVGTYYHPTEALGGDFYNFYRIGNQFVFYLSDVTGHGLDAAIISVFIRNTIYSLLSLMHGDERISPLAIVRHLHHRYLQEQFPYDYFICILVGVLDEETGELVYCSAGFQNAPLLRSAEGQVHELPCEGLLISGAFDEELSSAAENRIRLQPGETLLFTTDGLPEQRIQDGLYESRLQTVFAAEGLLQPAWIVEAINQDFRHSWGTNEGDDDITFLLLQAHRSDFSEVRFTIPSQFDAIDPAEQQLCPFFAYADDSDMLCMAFHEMLVNAIEHGNQMDPEKNVTITACTTTDYIQLDIEDEGDGFDWQTKKAKELDPASFAERGRGIIMTKMAVDRIRYNQRGNAVSLLKMRR